MRKSLDKRIGRTGRLLPIGQYTARLCFLKMEGLDDVQRKEKAKKKGRYMDISVKRLAKTAIANRD